MCFLSGFVRSEALGLQVSPIAKITVLRDTAHLRRSLKCHGGFQIESSASVVLKLDEERGQCVIIDKPQPPHSLSSQFRVFGTHRTILRGKRPCPARLDHRNRYSPLTNTVSNRRSSIAEHGPDNTCNHPRMSKGKTALNVRFGKRLGALRKEQGWTFVYLSEHSGLAKGFLHALEQGTQEPCLNTLDILAKSFEMTICDFMRGV